MSTKPRKELKVLSIHGQWVRWISYRYGYTRSAIAEYLRVVPSNIAAYDRPKGSRAYRQPGEPTRRRLRKLAGDISEAQYFRGPPSKVQP